MGRITRFDSLYGDSYSFPTYPGDQDYKDNFKDILTKSTRLPGGIGGIDEYGIGIAAKAIGDIQFSIVLDSSTREGMQALRDDLGEMYSWGLGRLFFQPTDVAATERWCWCRLSNITVAEQRNRHTDLHQPVRLNFHAPDPFWYTAGTELLWDNGSLWDGASLTWDGTGSLTSFTDSGTMTVTNAGNAFTLPSILVYKDTAGQADDILIERIVNNRAVDSFLLDTTLFNGGYVLIDTRAHRTLNAGGIAEPAITYLHPDWFRLMPGSNSIKVTLSGTVKIRFSFMERYI